MRDDMREIRISSITVRDNVRASLGDIDELTRSIKENGLMQPILVRRCGEGYELVTGHRRLAAFKLLKRDLIPAVIRDVQTSDRSVLQLIENVHRQDLSPYDIGCALRMLLKKLGGVNNVGYACKKSHNWVSEYLDYARIYDELIAAGETPACVAKLSVAAMLEFDGVAANVRHEIMCGAVPPGLQEKAPPARQVRRLIMVREGRPDGWGTTELTGFSFKLTGARIIISPESKIARDKLVQRLLELGGRRT